MSDATLKRVMPHNLEAESTVVGSMLMNKDAISTVAEILTAEDFYNPNYALVYTAIRDLDEGGINVDPLTVSNKLKQLGAPPDACNTMFIMQIIDSVISSAKVKDHAVMVYEASMLRQLIRLNEEIANTCYGGQEEFTTILSDTESKMFALLEKKETSQDQDIKDIVFEALEKISQAAKVKGTITGIPTGFLDLDFMTAGMQPSDLVLIAARPSMGKTAFVLNIAQHVAVKKDLAVAIFSLEMSKAQLVNRMFSLEGQVNAQGLRTGTMNDEEWDKLAYGANNIANSKLHIDDTASISISDMRSKCRKYKSSKKGLDMIIIDYLQLMSGRSDGRSESRQQEISEISRSLKALARELEVPILALSQLSRAVEQRPDKRPMLSDLRESGAIEQDADVVMFIYRDDYYNKDSERKGIAEVIIAKQRNGPIGTVELAWLSEFTKFANCARDFDTP